MHGVIMKFMENSWFHVHDSAPAHRSVLVKDFLAKNDVTVLDHPSYWLGCSWMLHIPATQISMEGRALLWCYWHH